MAQTFIMDVDGGVVTQGGNESQVWPNDATFYIVWQRLTRNTRHVIYFFVFLPRQADKKNQSAESIIFDL